MIPESNPKEDNQSERENNPQKDVFVPKRKPYHKGACRPTPDNLGVSYSPGW
jgi:hypothetical protein